MRISTSVLWFFLLLALVFGLIKEASNGIVPGEGAGDHEWGMAGHWFELARLPNPEQADCISDDQMSLLPDGNDQLSRVFVCRNSQNLLQATLSQAQSDNDVVIDHTSMVEQTDALHIEQVLHQPNADWLSYRIYYMSDDFQSMILGSEDKQYGWIMARVANLSEKRYQELMEHARMIGFDVLKINRTVQHPESLPFIGKSMIESVPKPEKSTMRLMVQAEPIFHLQ
ncbi:lipocalin family protein [Ampullimonas aquatilis]|uniref:lipocalin family protein n=1 Tax=Ampullimonas aquatilis TaxID=1341549 RepID=UPI003C756D48